MKLPKLTDITLRQAWTLTYSIHRKEIQLRQSDVAGSAEQTAASSPTTIAARATGLKTGNGKSAIQMTAATGQLLVMHDNLTNTNSKLLPRDHSFRLIPV